MRTLHVGLLGFGTVGGGVFRLLAENGTMLREREGLDIRVDRVLVRNPEKNRQISAPVELLTTSPGDIMDHPEISVVVEMLGGLEPARTLILEALAKGKTVVTANKDVVATYWDELQKAAAAHGAGLYYEASVAGGIPIIRAIRQSLQGNRISRIMGIINGTTNYILTRMSEEGRSFESVLSDAQRLGYAEPNPANDIEGHDAKFKLAILSNLCFGHTIRLSDIHCEGITRITADDIAFGKQLGYTVKLLALGRATPEGVDVRVHPTFIPSTHPLASVRDANNAIFIEGNAVGELMFYGRGAGDMPTASAIVSDILVSAGETRCGTVVSAGTAGHVRNAGTVGTDGNAANIENAVEGPGPAVSHPVVLRDWQTECYIRMTVADNPGVLAAIAGIFGRHGVSIESVIQKGRSEGTVPLIFVTHKAGEEGIRAATAEILQHGMVRSVDNLIRVER